MNPLADVHVDENDGVQVARVEGEVDISNVGEVRDAIVSEVRNDAIGLVVDLSATSYIDSAGIRLLFHLRSRLSGRGQQLRLVVHPGSPIAGVFALTDLAGAVPSHATRNEAVAETVAAHRTPRATPGGETDI